MLTEITCVVFLDCPSNFILFRSVLTAWSARVTFRNLHAVVSLSNIHRRLEKIINENTSVFWNFFSLNVKQTVFFGLVFICGSKPKLKKTKRIIQVVYVCLFRHISGLFGTCCDLSRRLCLQKSEHSHLLVALLAVSIFAYAICRLLLHDFENRKIKRRVSF